MTVEDHPLWTVWKARLEELLAAKAAMQTAAEAGAPSMARAATARYNAALSAYTKIPEEI